MPENPGQTFLRQQRGDERLMTERLPLPSSRGLWHGYFCPVLMQRAFRKTRTLCGLDCLTGLPSDLQREERQSLPEEVLHHTETRRHISSIRKPTLLLFAGVYPPLSCLITNNFPWRAHLVFSQTQLPEIRFF